MRHLNGWVDHARPCNDRLTFSRLVLLRRLRWPKGSMGVAMCQPKLSRLLPGSIDDPGRRQWPSTRWWGSGRAIIVAGGSGGPAAHGFRTWRGLRWLQHFGQRVETPSHRQGQCRTSPAALVGGEAPGSTKPAAGSEGPIGSGAEGLAHPIML